MNEKQLRALVREEIEVVLDEESQCDSHPKFRRLVEVKRGKPFKDEDSWWDTTFGCWSEARNESLGGPIDKDTLTYYVDRAVALIEN